MEVKPIIVDDDHRRGWPEADPAVAQEPNATKHSLPLSLSFPSLHPPPPPLYLCLLRLFLQVWQTNILRGLRACNYPINASDFQVPRASRERYALDWLRNLSCHWGACWRCPPGFPYSFNFNDSCLEPRGDLQNSSFGSLRVSHIRL